MKKSIWNTIGEYTFNGILVAIVFASVVGVWFILTIKEPNKTYKSFNSYLNHHIMSLTYEIHQDKSALKPMIKKIAKIEQRIEDLKRILPEAKIKYLQDKIKEDIEIAEMSLEKAKRELEESHIRRSLKKSQALLKELKKQKDMR